MVGGGGGGGLNIYNAVLINYDKYLEKDKLCIRIIFSDNKLVIMFSI